MKWKNISFLIVVVLIIVVDEFFKKIALENLPPETILSSQKIIALAIHKNYGIAFDLPLWLPLVIIATLVILIGLVFYGIKEWDKNQKRSLAFLIISLGALGNLFDRIVYGFTVDYIITPPTTSAFNLSDLVIIFGIVFLILSYRKK